MNVLNVLQYTTFLLDTILLLVITLTLIPTLPTLLCLSVSAFVFLKKKSDFLQKLFTPNLHPIMLSFLHSL